MQTCTPQERVPRKGREGASPSRRTKESEPVRELGLVATECAVPAVAFESSALRSWRMNRAGVPASLGRRLGQETGWDSSSPSSAQGR